MNYAYIRVSTGKQTVDNQRLEIKKYCKYKRLTKVQFCEETISGIRDIKKRKLGKLIDAMESGDTLIITEISRLGRSVIMVLRVLQQLLDKGIKVYSIKENYELGDNIQSQVLAFAFGLSAQIERNLISERTKMGLARAKSLGKQIGRKKGQKNKEYKLSKYDSYILKELRKGRSKRSLAIELGVTWCTLQRYIYNHSTFQSRFVDKKAS